MSLATICSRMAALVGVAPAQTWAGNPDITASEIVAWVQEAQQQVASSHDWATLLADYTTTLAPGSDEATIALPDNLARIVPDTVWLEHWPATGPLTQREWQERDRRYPQPFSLYPVFTLSGGDMLLAGASAGGTLAWRYVQAVPDFVSDPDVTVLGAGQAELIRLMERAILYSAIALYRDAKGLPPNSAAAQAMATIADARGRDQPVGIISLMRRRRGLVEARGRNPQFILDNMQSFMQ